MRRTYIPKLLRMAQEVEQYLARYRGDMALAAQLNPEQVQVLSALLTALRELDQKIGRPLFPEVYERKSRARPSLPWDQRPSFRELYQRQEGRCYYCGCQLYNGAMSKTERRRCKPGIGPQAWEIDHAQPRGRKGKDERANYRLACVQCNRHKGLLTEEEFMAVIALRNGGTASNPGA
jgi:5-methylcytosine-specific restriction endonuclease McrA